MWEKFESNVPVCLASEQQNQSRGQYPAEHEVWRMQKARWPQLNGNYQYGSDWNQLTI